MDAKSLKIKAAAEALTYVKDGMRLGIGTGSTAEEFVRLLADKVASGMNVIGVPTSERTAALCRELGVKLTTLEETPQLDLTIDGADEVDPELALIKGGGGALLREKIVAAASSEMIVIADESKLVKALRMTGDEAFVTDGGHLILDASFGRIPDTRALSNALHAIPGVVEHGLFLGLARVAILAGADGIRTLLSRASA